METRHIHETVHSLRQKPLHVRENIALGVAGGITAIVAVGWFAATAVSGTFSLAPKSIPTNTAAPAFAKAADSTKTSFDSLLGAAGAAVGATNTPNSITIVDTQVHSTLDANRVDPNATVIHL